MKVKYSVLAVLVMLLMLVGTVFASYDSGLDLTGAYTFPVIPNYPKWTVSWWVEWSSSSPNPPYDGDGYIVTNWLSENVCEGIGTANSTCPYDPVTRMGCREYYDDGIAWYVVCEFPWQGDIWYSLINESSYCPVVVWYEGPEDWDMIYYSGDTAPCVNWSAPPPYPP